MKRKETPRYIVVIQFVKKNINSKHIIIQCSRTESLNVFFNEIQVSSVPKIAIIGCGCSTATEPVAEISHYWNISQVQLLPIIMHFLLGVLRML